MNAIRLLDCATVPLVPPNGKSAFWATFVPVMLELCIWFFGLYRTDIEAFRAVRTSSGRESGGGHFA
jgi:hypothetical protein